MYTLCWSAKGGSGTTVVACALATLAARSRPTLLVDLGGDVGAVLGASTSAGAGVADWLASPHAPAHALAHLAVEVTDRLSIVPTGQAGIRRLDAAGAERLAHACAAATTDTTTVVVDAGPFGHHEVLHRVADRSLIVLRPCYLSLRRAVQQPGLAREVVVISEPGRAYSTADIERVLGMPVVAEVASDPAVARSVDAGQLARRVPSSLSRPLGRLVRAQAH
ncbi:MAG: hypothetical protein ACK5CE_22680 [Actinomycetes bacterium]|jgi:MinD-like ATPase involved in chromosome partitioning or flagellar assembly|uniref:Unannotated protein n=1 Tax=freshwater metagenome TaxID=449393 RepID=A0A6J6FL66_9ZZZZ|nr:hypothetical protein [Actinomycetota bacterium]